MKKLIEVSLKSIIFFIGWAICASVIPIPDIDNAALWRFFAELIPFLAIVVMSVIFWFVDRKKTKLHLTQRPVYSSVLGGTVGLSWLGISVGILLFTGSARIEGTNHISMLWLWILSAFINTIMQEMLVRGYLYQMIKRNYNVVAATVVSTILFIFCIMEVLLKRNYPCFECFDNEFVYDSSFGIYKFFDCPYNRSFSLE